MSHDNMTHDTVMTAAATRSQRRAPPVREAGRRLLTARHGGYTDTRIRGDRAFVTQTRALEISGDLSVSWLTLLIPAESSPSRIPETSVRSRAVARWRGALLWNTRNDGEVKSIC